LSRVFPIFSFPAGSGLFRTGSNKVPGGTAAYESGELYPETSPILGLGRALVRAAVAAGLEKQA
jgi:hypothetical protein